MNKNKKIIGAGIAVAVAVFFVPAGILAPWKRLQVLKRVIPEQEKKYQRMVVLQRRYAGLRAQLQRFTEQQPDIGADSRQWVQEQAVAAGLQVKTADDGAAGFQLSAVCQQLSQLVPFIYALEQPSSPVILRTAAIRKDQQLLFCAQLKEK